LRPGQSTRALGNSAESQNSEQATYSGRNKNTINNNNWDDNASDSAREEVPLLNKSKGKQRVIVENGSSSNSNASPSSSPAPRQERRPDSRGKPNKQPKQKRAWVPRDSKRESLIGAAASDLEARIAGNSDARGELARQDKEKQAELQGNLHGNEARTPTVKLQTAAVNGGVQAPVQSPQVQHNAPNPPNPAGGQQAPGGTPSVPVLVDPEVDLIRRKIILQYEVKCGKFSVNLGLRLLTTSFYCLLAATIVALFVYYIHPHLGGEDQWLNKAQLYFAKFLMHFLRDIIPQTEWFYLFSACIVLCFAGIVVLTPPTLLLVALGMFLKWIIFNWRPYEKVFRIESLVDNQTGEVFDLRGDSQSLGKLKHWDCYHARVRYDYYQLYTCFQIPIKVQSDILNVSMELFTQVCGPHNMMPNLTPQQVEDKVNYASRSNNSVNIDRWGVVRYEDLYWDTVILALAKHAMKYERSIELGFQRPPATLPPNLGL